MPELPEIETIKNDLTPQLVGRTIKGVTFPPDPGIRILRRFSSPQKFIREIKGTRVQGLERRAKYLLFQLQPSRTLIIHLGMSGQLLTRPIHFPPEPYTRAIFHLSDDLDLRFVDPRKFGEIFLQLPVLNSCPLNFDQFGPEPLGREFTCAYLTGIFKKSRRQIKTLLLDQKAVSGLGNIYTDEALFRAKIHPTRIASTLSQEEIDRLRHEIQKILQAAIKNRGTTAADKRYRDGLGRMGKFQSLLQVYQRFGYPCFHCGTTIERTRLGGRTASFCPKCQV